MTRYLFSAIIVVALLVFGSGALLVSSGAQESVTSWQQTMHKTSAPYVGCFESTYPSTTWTQVECSTPPTIPLTVGNGNDWVGASSGNLIGDISTGMSMSGFTSESDSSYGSNYYSIQVNSQTFSTTIFNGNSATGWEQFVFINQPGSSQGQVYIQYWLIGYKSTYGSCPSTSPSGVGAWTAYGNDCYANSGSTITPLENPSGIANYSPGGTANNYNNGIDENIFCASTTCYTVSVTDTVLSLYKHWTDSEVNVLGYCCGDTANFNSGTSIGISVDGLTGNGLGITFSCVNTGYTGEMNNLNLGSCTGVLGQYRFSE